MFCGQCGTKNDEEALFCASCGTPTQALATPFVDNNGQSPDYRAATLPLPGDTPVPAKAPIDPDHLKILVWSSIGLLILLALVVAGWFAIQKYQVARQAEIAADNEAFGIAAQAGTVGALEAYLETCGDVCEHKQDAESGIDDLKFAAAKSAATDAELHDYIKNCGESCGHKEDAEKELDNRAYAVALATDTEAAFKHYVENCSLCQHKAQAQQLAVVAAAEAERKAKQLAAAERVKGMGNVRRVVLVTEGYASNCADTIRNQLRRIGITPVAETEDHDAYLHALISTPAYFSNSWASGYKARYSVTVKRIGDGKVLLSRSGSELGTSASDNCADAAEQIADDIRD